ncbi:hypothetical protein OIU79_011057 [Salix purpurea]|uniref:Uncharacterized protein n=1 Tax=Salix purpurea TaxID=77065 RepID=A0A9Q0TAI7_SALPP|nr:hypothetical protein OIU79_011057 [Salix purpurea]
MGNSWVPCSMEIETLNKRYILVAHGFYLLVQIGFR